MESNGGQTASSPRIVLLTGAGLEHRYVAHELALGLALAGMVVDHGRKAGALDTARRLWRRYTVPQLFSRACLALLRRLWRDQARRQATLLALFGSGRCSGFPTIEKVFHVSGVNSPECVDAVRSLQPDILLVFGTTVVGQKILSLPRQIALNLHTGISPYYRGCDCTFWPLHNEELHLLGATVHECTSALDGGKIFGTVQVKVEAEDGLDAVFARCVQAGAGLYVRTVRELVASRATGTAQDLTLGIEYRAFMRGVRAEWATRRKIGAGLIRRHANGGANSRS